LGDEPTTREVSGLWKGRDKKAMGEKIRRAQLQEQDRMSLTLKPQGRVGA
jgi:hypothetical protein